MCVKEKKRAFLLESDSSFCPRFMGEYGVQQDEAARNRDVGSTGSLLQGMWSIFREGGSVAPTPETYTWSVLDFDQLWQGRVTRIQMDGVSRARARGRAQSLGFPEAYRVALLDLSMGKYREWPPPKVTQVSPDTL